MSKDVIVAISTPLAPSAIGIIRLSGKGCFEMLERVFRPINKDKITNLPNRKLILGDLLDSERNIIDRPLACTFKGPYSYTGEDSAEIHCHGSQAVSYTHLAAEHPEIPGLYLLTSPLSVRPSEVDKRAFETMLKKIRRKFHYCLIDAPAGLGDGFELAAKYADMAIVTATIDLASQRGAGLARQALERLGVKKSYMVVNRAVPKMMAKTGLNIDDMMDTVGLPLLGVVPEDSAIFEAASSGTSIALFNKKRALRAYANIARRITGQRVPLMKI